MTVRYADRPSLPATPNREFRLLVNEELGCLDVTQFVGLIPPGPRAAAQPHLRRGRLRRSTARASSTSAGRTRRSGRARASTCRRSRSTASRTRARRRCACSASSTRPAAPRRRRTKLTNSTQLGVLARTDYASPNPPTARRLHAETQVHPAFRGCGACARSRGGRLGAAAPDGVCVEAREDQLRRSAEDRLRDPAHGRRGLPRHRAADLGEARRSSSSLRHSA